MIRPAHSTAHGASNVDFFDMSLTCDDIVECVPLLRSWMLPGGFVFVGLLEEPVGDGKLVLRAGLQQQGSV